MNRLVDEAKIKNAYAQALDIMETVGIRFDNDGVREIFKKHGARIEDEKVFITRILLEETLASTPKQDYNVSSEKRLVASTPFGTAPFILDDQTGLLRRCNIEDAIMFYQINETSSIYECVNPGCCDPLGNDAPDQFVSQIAMALKYSDKYPSLGLRATRSTSKNQDVYGSACQAFRMAREFYDIWDKPVLTQGICPNPPLAYDRECLDNLCAALDEKQAISLMPCSLGFITAPESIMGIVIHDFAMALAGLVFVQLKSPGHPISICEFSTNSNIRTLQPNYGSVESVYIQVAFYELCKFLSIPCSISGGYGDGTQVDYQAGMEATLTSLLPFNLTEISEVWCTPGILSGFSCGSFYKAILDEEMMHYANWMLKGTDMILDEKLPQMLSKGVHAGGFLGIGKMKTYNRDNFIPQVFNKWGMGQVENPNKSDLSVIAKQKLESRVSSYTLPERTDAQKKILQTHLPSKCRY